MPVVVIMAAHLAWLALAGRLQRGFSGVIYLRTAQTAVAMAVAFMLSAIFAPKPAFADAGDALDQFLAILFCVAVLAVIGGVLALVMYLVGKLILGAIRSFSKDDDDGPDARFFDIGSLTVATLALVVLSVEGVTHGYAFATDGQGASVQQIDASPAQVWATLEQATSPESPLPNILQVIPQPVGIPVDEGTELGSLRQVNFQG